MSDKSNLLREALGNLLNALEEEARLQLKHDRIIANETAYSSKEIQQSMDETCEATLAASKAINDAKAALSAPSLDAWNPIIGEIKRKVLVTNNLNGRDGIGQMSHVWCVQMVHETRDAEGPYTAFDNADRRITGLTHYAEIPTASGIRHVQ